MQAIGAIRVIRAIWFMALKDLRLLLRDRAGSMFTFVVPILFALFFGTIFSGGGSDGSIPLGVVDEDASEVSRDFIGRLDQATELSVVELERASAAERVRHGDLAAFVVIPEGFGQLRERLLTGQSATIELGVDPARRAEAAMLQGVLTRYFFDTLSRLVTQPDQLRPYVQSARLLLTARSGLTGDRVDSPLYGLLGELDTFLAEVATDRGGEGTGSTPDQGTGTDPDQGAWQPLEVSAIAVEPDRMGPDNAFEISFPQGLMWGLIACAASFATSLVHERNQGTLIRLRSAPVARAHILGSKALACFLTGVGLVALMMIVGALFFDVRPDSIGLLALATVAVVLAFTGIMMLLSLIGRTERATSGIAWAVLMILAMIGGGMMPLFFMPDWLQSLAAISPIKWAILALEGALWRGFDLAEMAPPVAILTALGVGCMAVGARVFRLTE